MKKIYLLLLLLLYSFFTFSQKEANNWIFGSVNHLDFNSNPVDVNTISSINFFPGRNSVSLSDENGNLLFYSDGTSIFNKAHLVMPNGAIQSNSAASHPLFVIPKPGSDHGYYMIINTPGFSSPSLVWIEIDMNLDGGLGDVVPNVGGTLLNNPTGKITAVLHANSNDIWIVGHELESNIYHSWLATENGISNSSETSPIGSQIQSSVANSQDGQIKTSPNGDRIAVVNTGLNTIEIFNFNRLTGTLYNPIILSGFFEPYGLEFSPSGKFLYVSQSGNFSNGIEIFQLNITSNTPTSIMNSSIFLGSSFGFVDLAGGLQLAPDGKIYIANTGDISLSIIHQPEAQGADVNFEQFGLILFSGEVFGLPSFFHQYFKNPSFSYEGFCLGSATHFSIDAASAIIDSVEWNFGDPLSGDDNTSTLLNPSHFFIESGSYNVSLTIYSNNQILETNQIIQIAPASIELGQDLTICSNEELVLDVFTPNATYQWSNGSTQPFLTVDAPGTYWVNVLIDNCPTLTDTITINHLAAPNADLGEDGGLCNGDAVVLDVSNPNATYLWSTGSTTSQITIFFGGTYSITVTNPNGCTDVDEVSYFFDQVGVTPSQANLACFGDSNGVALVFPAIGQSPFSYEWDDGDTLYTNNQLTAGNYSITVTDNLGCTVVQEFTITEPPKLEVDVVINADNPNTSDPDGAILFQPDGGVPPYLYHWELFGETDDPLKMGLGNGIYHVTISDKNECEEVMEVNVGDVTSTYEISLLEKIKVFPNPTSDYLFIKSPETFFERMEISITNILGQPIQDILFDQQDNTELIINVTNLKDGIYFLRIKEKMNERVWKFNVIQN